MSVLKQNAQTMALQDYLALRFKERVKNIVEENERMRLQIEIYKKMIKELTDV